MEPLGRGQNGLLPDAAVHVPRHAVRPIVIAPSCEGNAATSRNPTLTGVELAVSGVHRAPVVNRLAEKVLEGVGMVLGSPGGIVTPLIAVALILWYPMRKNDTKSAPTNNNAGQAEAKGDVKNYSGKRSNWSLERSAEAQRRPLSRRSSHDLGKPDVPTSHRRDDPPRTR